MAPSRGPPQPRKISLYGAALAIERSGAGTLRSIQSYVSDCSKSSKRGGGEGGGGQQEEEEEEEEEWHCVTRDPHMAGGGKHHC